MASEMTFLRGVKRRTKPGHIKNEDIRGDFPDFNLDNRPIDDDGEPFKRMPDSRLAEQIRKYSPIPGTDSLETLCRLNRQNLANDMT